MVVVAIRSREMVRVSLSSYRTTFLRASARQNADSTSLQKATMGSASFSFLATTKSARTKKPLSKKLSPKRVSALSAGATCLSAVRSSAMRQKLASRSCVNSSLAVAKYQRASSSSVNFTLCVAWPHIASATAVLMRKRSFTSARFLAAQ